MKKMQFLGIKWKEGVPYILYYDNFNKKMIYEQCVRNN